jgi:hypothetical protein
MLWLSAVKPFDSVLKEAKKESLREYSNNISL